MNDPIEQYWKLRLEDCKKALEANNFEVFIAQNALQAREIILAEIVPQSGAKRISWGDSMTLDATGVLETLLEDPSKEVLITFDKSLPRDEIIERRRQALLVDLFFTGTNAVTETGQLVNLDMVGNRVGAITFGPHNVVILVGRNKIVCDLEEARFRIKNYAAPVNAMRHDFTTPCAKTSFCSECRSPNRICNVWTITEKSYPKHRIKIIIINDDLGL